MNIAIFNDTRTREMHIGCSIVISNLEDILLSHNCKIRLKYSLESKHKLDKDRIKKDLSQNNIDIVLVNGEGTLHHSCNKSYVMFLSELAKFIKVECGCRILLVNSTLYKNTSTFYENLRYYDEIFVRESQSLDELKYFGLSGKVVPDLTFYTDIPNVYQRSQRAGILITDSVSDTISCELRSVALINKWAYISMIRRGRNLLHRCYRLSYLFINLYNIYHDIKFSSTPDEFIANIGNSEMVITGRYHTVTLCLLTETPFLAIESNTPKISGLLQDVFGTNKRVLSNTDTIDAVTIKKYKKYTPHEQMQLCIFNKRARQDIIDMGKDIAQI